MSHLVFLPGPDKPRFFLWGTAPISAGGETPALGVLRERGRPARERVVGQALAVEEAEGTAVALLEALPALASLSADESERAPASLAAWSLAAKLALELVARERIVPRVARTHAGASEARWGVALSAREDAERVAALAKAMPPAAHAVPVNGGAAPGRPKTDRVRSAAARVSVPTPAPVLVWQPEALLRAFLDAAADAIARKARSAGANPGPTDAGGADTTSISELRAAAARAARRRSQQAPEARHAAWEERFTSALTGGEAAFEPEGFRERNLLEELESWAAPARGEKPGTPRGCLRLELPANETAEVVRPRARVRAGTRARSGAGGEPFLLRYFLQAHDDPSLLLPAEDVWSARGARLQHLGRSFESPQEHLLRTLGTAARLFPPIQRSLAEARPASLALDPSEAWSFLGQAAAALGEAGLSVLLPAELTRAGQRRLKLRMRVGGGAETAGVVQVERGFGQDEILAFRWEVALGDQTLSAGEFAALAKLKAPLVRWRGQWIGVDPAELAEAGKLLSERGGRLSAVEALRAALTGETQHAGASLPAEVVAEGSFARALERLRGGAAREIAVPRAFRGTLRPYQERGLAWLVSMAELGLGACLADDMGLGKTIQILAFLLQRREIEPEDRRPALLVCPTSVVGNWECEIARFAPALGVVRHYGPERARSAEELVEQAAGARAAEEPARQASSAGRSGARAGGALVLTSYGLLRRDAELLAAVDWSAAILDEAQNIKNASSRGARAARALRATRRFALTGTPVENRLAELWSILEFAAPGLLGTSESFRRAYALPIERWRDERAAEQLSRIVRPFLLRRLKSDPAVIQDLPPKNEMKVVCTLTREQATLYQAAVDNHMARIEDSDGMQRRGLVLALLTALKQICNHPAQYLGESGPLSSRSGKLARITEMLEECLAEGDRALIFTQYREMGERLVAHLSRALSIEVPFLHGGTPRAARDELVRRFQEEQRGPRAFVLSLKAGGTGLNLTAANRVFHFDRWWNPAVEDQATDRAWRIGQTRAVAVHKLLCAGTVEEKVDKMLEEKRALAASVVGAGEAWITEMQDGELRELFALSSDAVVAAEDSDSDGDDTSETAATSRDSANSSRRAAARRPSTPSVALASSGRRTHSASARARSVCAAQAREEVGA